MQERWADETWKGFESFVYCVRFVVRIVHIYDHVINKDKKCSKILLLVGTHTEYQKKKPNSAKGFQNNI